MSNEINEIHQNLNLRKANITANVQSVNQPEKLEKSHIVDAFTYGENKLFISKTGTELKGALEVCKAANEAKLTAIKLKADEYLAKCPSQPTEDWNYDDYKVNPSDILPKRFPWRIIDAYGDSLKAAQPIVQEVTAQTILGEVTVKQPNVRPENFMEMYNDCISQWCRVRKDNAMISTIINGLEDKTTYKLSIAQANAIGL